MADHRPDAQRQQNRHGYQTAIADQVRRRGLRWFARSGLLIVPQQQNGLPGMPISRCFSWCPGTESNCRHGDFQSPALPTELPGLGMAALADFAVAPTGKREARIKAGWHPRVKRLAPQSYPPGLKSGGASAPSPKKNFSICSSRKVRFLGSMGLRRYSLMSMV